MAWARWEKKKTRVGVYRTRFPSELPPLWDCHTLVVLRLVLLHKANRILTPEGRNNWLHQNGITLFCS
jgi:hypothetical protein